MPISFGPYKSAIPLVNVEEVHLNLAQQEQTYAQGIMRTGSVIAPNTLDITVQLSNETPLTPPPHMNIGNWVYFTFDEEEARNLVRKQNRAKNLIRTVGGEGDESLVVKMRLQPRDLKKTTTMVEAPPLKKGGDPVLLPLRTNKIRRTVRIPVPGSLKNANLYMVVASFVEHKNVYKIGNILNHVLLQNGRVPQRSNLYTLAESIESYGMMGSIWPGAVHMHNDVPMAGRRHSSHSHPRLESAEVPNIKVKDMRIMTLVNNTSPQYVAPNEIKPYVSPLQISRASTGIANGMFSFDLAAYIAMNSSLAGIMTNNTSLVESAAIEDIIIWQKPSSLDASGNSLTPVGETYCGLNADRGYTRVASLGDGCEVLNTLSNGNTILNVSFVDDTVVNRGSGFAEYKVEILLADRATDVVSSAAKQLGEMTTQASNQLRLNRDYDFQLYARTARTYLNILEYLLGSKVFEPYTREYWESSMMAMLYGPQQGDQEKLQLMTGIAAFVQRLNNLVQKAPMATVTATNFRSTIDSMSDESILRLEHSFSKKLHLQGTKNIGLGYIDATIQNLGAAIPQIYHEAYRSRANQEIDKYNIANSNATNVNRFGYLSPAFIGMGRQEDVRTESLSLSNQGTLSLFNSNLNTNLNLNMEPRESMQVKSLETLRSVGVAVAPLKVPLKKEVLAPDVVRPDTPAASDYLSSNSSFYLNNRTALDEVSGSQREILQTRRAVLNNSPLIATIVDRAMLSFRPSQTMANTDLIRGSVASIKNDESPQSVIDSSALTSVINFGSIAKVEYLSAYNSEMGVKQQNWLTLDSTTFENAIESSQPLICRLVKVTNTVPSSPAVRLDPMAAYFVLGPITVRTTMRLPLPNLIAGRESELLVRQLEFLGDEILYSCNTIPHQTGPGGGNK